MNNIIIILSFLIGATSLFHIVAIAGGPVGPAMISGSYKGRLPLIGRLLSLAILLLLSVLEVTLLSKVGILMIHIHDMTYYILISMMLVVMISHMITKSKIDRYIWSPIYVVILTASSLIFLSP